MKRILPVMALLLAFASPSAFASDIRINTIPVQFPPGQMPGQMPGQPPMQAIDPFTGVEQQQLMHETLTTLRDMVNVMGAIPSIPERERQRLDDISERLDFLITRQQDLAMRQRMGR